MSFTSASGLDTLMQFVTEFKPGTEKYNMRDAERFFGFVV